MIIKVLKVGYLITVKKVKKPKDPKQLFKESVKR